VNLGLKTKLIKYTGRETLLYKIIDASLFELLCFINYLKYGHIIRKNYIKNYLLKYENMKLQIGSGGELCPGFLNSNVIGGPIHLDIRKKLPFKNSILDTIYGNSVIAHIYKKDLMSFLKESYRVLKSDGKLILNTPDIKKIVSTFYFDKEYNKMVIISKKHMDVSLDDNFYIASFINNISHLFHAIKYIYDFEYLRHLLELSGFKNVKLVDNTTTSDKDINEMRSGFKGKYWDFTTMTIEAEK